MGELKSTVTITLQWVQSQSYMASVKMTASALNL